MASHDETATSTSPTTFTAIASPVMTTTNGFSLVARHHVFLNLFALILNGFGAACILVVAHHKSLPPGVDTLPDASPSGGSLNRSPAHHPPPSDDPNGASFEPAPVARASRLTRIKVWSLYLTVLNAYPWS